MALASIHYYLYLLSARIPFTRDGGIRTSGKGNTRVYKKAYPTEHNPEYFLCSLEERCFFKHLHDVGDDVHLMPEDYIEQDAVPVGTFSHCLEQGNAQ